MNQKEKLELLLEWGIFQLTAEDIKSDFSESMASMASMQSFQASSIAHESVDDPLMEFSIHSTLDSNDQRHHNTEK